MNTSEILPILIPALLQWFIYSALVWLFIKIQRVRCNVVLLGLVSAAAVATTFVPTYGIWISFAVLLILLPLATRKARLAHSVLAVVLAGGSIFALNTWVLPSVTTDLVVRAEQWVQAATQQGEEEEEDNSVVAAAGDAEAVDSSLIDTNAVPAEPPPIPQVWQHETGLSVRGISYSRTRPLAMLALGGDVLTLGPGESLSVETREGTVRARCVAVERSYVRVEFEGGEVVDLLLD